jgi:hypothetical protein
VTLVGPSTEDKQKIHAEVNQIVNQRLLLSTLAVTVFGAMAAWLIPKSPPDPGSDIGTLIYIGSILLTVVLFALFLLTHHLTYMLRIFTTYLDVTEASSWETDWAAYRSKFKYLGYTKPLAIIFLLLGILATGFPFLLWVAYSLTLAPRVYAVVSGTIGGFYIVFVWGMGLSGWFAKEAEMKKKWQELKAK